MHILTLGINHKTAPVEVRERVAFSESGIEPALRALTARPDVEEASILSTCNRTEVIANLNRGDSHAVSDWFIDYFQNSDVDLSRFLIDRRSDSAISHMFRVASGLDSMVIGEPQILGQMKRSYVLAQQAGTIGKYLNRLFQHTFSVAKKVRTDTGIGASAVSVAYAAVTLAKHIFDNLSNQTALLIGAGETIELTTKHLIRANIGELIIANRTLEKAQTLADELGGQAIALSDIPRYLPKADIVVTSTASQLPILGKGLVESAVRRRKHKPMLMVDLAVPRDVEPQVDDLRDVYLYSIDDLRHIVEENRNSREQAIVSAEGIIDVETDSFKRWMHGQQATPIVKSYRDKAYQVRDDELARALAAIERGAAPADVLEHLAHTLTNKLIHSPSVAVSEAGRNRDSELLESACKVLQIKEPNH